MKKLLSAISIGTLLLLSSTAHSQQQATPVNGDTRLVTFEYDPDQTYLILTRPKSVTHIQLRPDEKVKVAAAGDTSSFMTVVSSDKNNLLIRPKYEGMTASFTLITNERSYPIMLRSTSETTGKWYQRVTWNFPELLITDSSEHDGLAKSEGALRAKPDSESVPKGGSVSISKLSTSYTIEGEAEFKPTNVFDDGTRTYIRFPDQLQTLPAVFAVSDGDTKLVNYHIEQDYAVIQGVMTQLSLHLGKSVVKVTKIQPKKSIFNFGGNGG